MSIIEKKFIENGFFLLLPDEESRLKLTTSVCKFPHVSILVIDDPKEILKLKNTFVKLDDDDIYEVPFKIEMKLLISGFEDLTMRSSKKIKVANFNDNTSLENLKNTFLKKFNLKSDIYGKKQKFHLSLETEESMGEIFNFDRCVFSIRNVQIL